jgi:hypothetical protein
MVDQATGEDISESVGTKTRRDAAAE